MESKNKKIQLIREQVDQSKNSGAGRHVFSNNIKQDVAALVQSGMHPRDLVKLTGLSSSSVNRWGKSKSEGFHKVSKESDTVQARADEKFHFKVTLQNEITLESTSKEILKIILGFES